MLGGLTPAHLLIILVIALIVIGPGKLPEVGAAIGKSVREFQKASGGIQETVTGALNLQTPPAQPPQHRAAAAPADLLRAPAAALLPGSAAAALLPGPGPAGSRSIPARRHRDRARGGHAGAIPSGRIPAAEPYCSAATLAPEPRLRQRSRGSPPPGLGATAPNLGGSRGPGRFP